MLKVIVWKNIIIRKRHWILTLLESLLPILLFLLIAYGRSKISGLQKIEIKDATYYEPEIITYDTLSIDRTYLYFAPNNEFYQDIIKRTQVKFDMYNNNIKGFDSKDALLQYYAYHNNNTVIAIIFNENNPQKFDYTIRYSDGSYDEGLDTSELYRNKFQFTPGVGTVYYWKGLLSIQKALDISFLEKSYTPLENNITINIQEFPYPPHKDDSAINAVFIIYLPLITIFSFIFLCPAVLKRVVEEKYTGIKELLKMVGMRSWMLWLGWFIYGMIPLLFSITCIVFLMKVPVFGTEYPPIEYSNGSVLFMFLLLYCMAAIVFCFAISSFFTKPTSAMVIGILIWILSYFVPKYSFNLLESRSSVSWVIGICLMFLPNMALHYGYAAISSYEEREIGIQWCNIYKGSSDSVDDVTMLNVFLMLLVDVLIYMIFTFYMDGINPGKYGIKKSLFFPFYSLIKAIRAYIVKQDIVKDVVSVNPENVEEGYNFKKGIEINHLHKKYGHKLAVNNLSLDIYQNQITVLLGHNGAGKSTTMSMITGMIDSTSGSIKINGVDIRNNMDELRNNLGLCPQHNLLFTDLTVGEHLQFFAMLKGKTAKQAKQDMKRILEILNLSEKKNYMANTLSGGMKRKLCLGMAIIGESKVLILDEPTSGMDPESRRELWDLLLSWRGEKTILITTHFMEEADALGDWIAIMANGELQCYGTPMYLKKKYDTGYDLSLMVAGSATKDEKDEIRRHVINCLENAQFKDMNGNNMIFVLPFENKTEIPKLLSSLEAEKDKLKIENISITTTTLEDVFLKAKLEFDSRLTKMIDLSLMVASNVTRNEREKIKNRIVSYIHNAVCKDANGNNMVFVLPYEKNMDIYKLISSLLAERDNLKIENISTTITLSENVFLKTKFEYDSKKGNEDLEEAGYHVSLVVSSNANEDEKKNLCSHIKSYIQKAQFRNMNDNNVRFIIPFENNMDIYELLCSLVVEKYKLQIENISVTVTTPKDILLKAKLEIDLNEDANDLKALYDINESDNMSNDPLSKETSWVKTFWKITYLRTKALIIKKLHFYHKKIVMYLIPALIASIFFFLTTYLSQNGNNYYRDNGPELKYQLSTYKQTMAFYNTSENDLMARIKSAYAHLIEGDKGVAEKVTNVQQAIINKGIENIVYYKEHLIASAEFKVDQKITVTALYNAIAVHSSPISLNLVTNTLAKALLGEEYSISSSSWPLPTINSNSSPQEYSEMKVGILWLIMIPLGCLFMVGSFILFPHMEVSTKFIQLQYICGVQPYIYWIVNFFADLCFYTIIISVLALIMLALTPFIRWEEFTALLALLFMYGVSGIPFSYIFSRKSSASGAFSLFIILGIFLGIILTVVIGVLLETGDAYYVHIGDILKTVFIILLPQYALTHLGVDFCRKAVGNYNMDVMPSIKFSISCSNNPNPCCFGDVHACEKYKSYWPLFGFNFLYMIISCLLFLSINIFWDTYAVKRCISKVIYRVLNLRKSKRTLNPNQYQSLQNLDNSKFNSFNAKHLYKTYSGKQIVNNIGFSLKNGDCLGILGVNGAGKTTTFRMLTREEIVDEGVVEIKGADGNINLDEDKYLENLGYCPQTDSLNFVLTGRQILRLMAQLRGIDDPAVVNTFLKFFELEEYADVPCGYYSGGNKRKLSLAVALMSYPKYVLLDEPTNGVDPSSRRKFWSLIKRIQETKKVAFILTSHSMVECEALCNNLKIMKNGKFEKEGTISELKKEFGGFSIKFKLSKKSNCIPKKLPVNDNMEVQSFDDVDAPSLTTEEDTPLIVKDHTPLMIKEDDLLVKKKVPHFDTVDQLKAYFTKGSGEVKDEHTGLLHLYIKDNKEWSHIFGEVEEIKKENSHLIEDYVIDEASLEDIFLSVARSEDLQEDNKKKKRKERKTI